MVEEVCDGAWCDERERKEVVTLVGDDLELNGGISLIPGSMHGEDLGACLIRAVDVLLSVVVNDVANGVPNSGRGEIR